MQRGHQANNWRSMMRVLVVLAGLVAFSAAPALAAGGCNYGKGTNQSVKVESTTQTASTQQSTAPSETKK